MVNRLVKPINVARLFVLVCGHALFPHASRHSVARECRMSCWTRHGTDTVDHSAPVMPAGLPPPLGMETCSRSNPPSPQSVSRDGTTGHRGTTGYRRRSMRKQPRCWRLYCPRQLGAVRWIPGQDSGGWWLADAVRTGLARGSVRGRDFSRPTQPIGQIRRPWLHLYVQSWAHRATDGWSGVARLGRRKADGAYPRQTLLAPIVAKLPSSVSLGAVGYAVRRFAQRGT